MLHYTEPQIHKWNITLLMHPISLLSSLSSTTMTSLYCNLRLCVLLENKYHVVWYFTASENCLDIDRQLRHKKKTILHIVCSHCLMVFVLSSPTVTIDLLVQLYQYSNLTEMIGAALLLTVTVSAHFIYSLYPKGMYSKWYSTFGTFFFFLRTETVLNKIMVRAWRLQAVVIIAQE